MLMGGDKMISQVFSIIYFLMPIICDKAYFSEERPIFLSLALTFGTSLKKYLSKATFSKL